jgi:hypothetical protein
MAKHKRSEKGVWNKFLIPGGLALALAVGAATWFVLQNPTPVSSAAQYKGGPRLVLDPELIDFGPVQFGRIVTARFRLRNVGDQPLRLAVDPRVEAIEGC